MGIVLDAVIVAIALLSIFLGYKRGLVKAIFNVFAFLVAIIATFIFYKPVSNLVINNTEIDNNIKNAIIEKYGVENTSEDGNEGFIEKAIQGATNMTREEAVEELADEISTKSVQVAVGIGLFVVIRILLVFLRFLTESLAELPIIKQFNSMGGALYGVLRGALIVYILVTALYLVVSVNNNGKIQEAVDNSYITKFLYNHNLIINTIDF